MAKFKHPPQGPVATIDMGSNSFHLLIVNWRQGRLSPVFVTVERVQTALLMQGDLITDEAEQRVLSCLRRFRDIADQHGCERIVAVGTSALRQASNADKLLAKAEGILGWPVIVLSGADEARLIYRAVAFVRSNLRDRMLVLDIGGGSTEIVTGSGGRIDDLESLPLGCVSSLKEYFPGGVLNHNNFEACVHAARQRLAPLESRFRVVPGMEAVGCSGTALAIAELLGLQQVSRPDLLYLRDRLLARFSRIEDVCIESLDNNRSRLLVPGLAVLIALVDAFAIARLATAEVALREGVALAWYQGDEALNSELSAGIAI